jgi:hypothetical protein
MQHNLSFSAGLRKYSDSLGELFYPEDEPLADYAAPKKPAPENNDDPDALSYLILLRSAVLEQKKGQLFSLRAGWRIKDSEDVYRRIRASDPSLYRRLERRLEKDCRRKKLSQYDLAVLLRKLGRGGTVRTKDASGRSCWIVNKSGKKGKLVCSVYYDRKSMDSERSRLLSRRMRRTVEGIYLKAAKRQERSKVRVAYSDIPRRYLRSQPFSGGFPEAFRQAVLQNRSASPESLASGILMSMSREEKKDLSRNLVAAGIRTGADFSMYIRRLRSQSLNSVEIRKTVTKVRKISRESSFSRSI